MTYKVLGQDEAGQTSTKAGRGRVLCGADRAHREMPVSLLPAVGKVAVYTGGPERKAWLLQLEQRGRR